MFPRVDIRHEKQSAILTFAEARGIELAEALEHFGCTFDDLIYENSTTRHWEGGKPTSLNDCQRDLNGIPVVSFFSGCGGMDIGFEAAGFSHMAAFEINELFCKTLRHNRPEWNVFGPPFTSGDVSDFEKTSENLHTLIKQDFEGVFIGGPPCQPFSIAANQRFRKSGDKFKRIGFASEQNGNLLLDYVRLIEHFRPACFVLENVPGLRDLDGGRQISTVAQRLGECGYDVGDPHVLNAAHYGVPQFRERLFVVGTRAGGRFSYPKKAEALIGCGTVLQRDRGQALNNETRVHKLASVRRYVKLDYGQRDSLGRVDRLDPCLPAKAVIAGGTQGGGRSHLHPEIPRTLSVRECARLQTFPDDYVFVGATARQFTQVGNAVPPALAAQIAIAIADSVFRVRF